MLFVKASFPSSISPSVLRGLGPGSGEAENEYETFISRIRKDDSQENTINLWIVSDNLLRGAALNAVEIAETLIKNNFYGK